MFSVFLLGFSWNLVSATNKPLFPKVYQYGIQNENFKLMRFGLGFSFGFFNPQEVNQYIENYLDSQGMLVSSGFSNIIMCFSARADIKIKPHKLFDINVFGEFTAAPKFITLDNGESLTYNFGKRSVGALANFNIPLGSGRHYFFLGAGPVYHAMKFEDFAANTFGPRFDFGIDLNFNKIELRPTFFFDIAKANDNEFTMNYTSGNVGISLLF